MKVSAKPISSPGRTEKFPPPLMRFLRSNVGSKSSRRSRASPMFIRGKKNAVIEATQEPSSPKVTCIGQVRVRRSKNKDKKKAKRTAAGNRRCRWLRWKLRPRSFRRVLGKWVSFFRCGYCKREEILQDSPVVEVIHRRSHYAGEYQEKGEDLRLRADDEVLIPQAPPKNAFLLTRCRSAPYRSSSLASKFWESTMEKTEEEEKEGNKTGEKEVEERTPNLGIKEEDEGNNGKENGGIDGGDSINGRSSGGVEELKAAGGGGPLILTRCKSEPARTGDKLFMSSGS